MLLILIRLLLDCELNSCNEHGQCKNGSCLCVTGWNGKHCTFEGCPQECSKHGSCKSTSTDGQWSCRCDKGWEGIDCSIPLELQCDDGLDNDKGDYSAHIADALSTKNNLKSLINKWRKIETKNENKIIW